MAKAIQLSRPMLPRRLAFIYQTVFCMVVPGLLLPIHLARRFSVITVSRITTNLLHVMSTLGTTDICSWATQQSNAMLVFGPKVKRSSISNSLGESYGT